MKPVIEYDRERFRKYGYEKFQNLPKNERPAERFHNGHDYDVPKNSYVINIAEGKIIFSGNVNGFGGRNPQKKGGVIITEHDVFGMQFTLLHGHIQRFHPVGLKVKRGYPLGLVDDYWDAGMYLPHLHFAVHKGLGIPETKFGYVTKKQLNQWYNALEFVEMLSEKYRENNITIWTWDF